MFEELLISTVLQQMHLLARKSSAEDLKHEWQLHLAV